MATHWQDDELVAAERSEYAALRFLGVAANERLLDYPSRPDALVASYAVLGTGWATDQEPALTYLDLYDAVSPHCPPSFVWTTAEDAVVPPSQSARFATALEAQGVEVEYHLYDRGEHGLSTATQVANADRAELPEGPGSWLPRSAAWLRETWGR